MAKAVIFDFDGVIVDSERHWPELSRTVFASFMRGTWSDDDQRKIVGHSMPNVYAILARDYGVTLAYPDYERIVLEHAAVMYDTRVDVMPDFWGALARIKTLGAATAIASSNKRGILQNTAARLGLEAHFPIIVSGDDVPPHRTKPHPDIYLLAAERLNIPAAECIAIEDSATGVTAAKAAGMHCIAYHADHNATHDLSAADTHVSGFDELTDETLSSLLALAR